MSTSGKAKKRRGRRNGFHALLLLLWWWFWASRPGLRTSTTPTSFFGARSCCMRRLEHLLNRPSCCCAQCCRMGDVTTQEDISLICWFSVVDSRLERALRHGPRQSEPMCFLPSARDLRGSQHTGSQNTNASVTRCVSTLPASALLPTAVSGGSIFDHVSAPKTMHYSSCTLGQTNGTHNVGYLSVRNRREMLGEKRCGSQ